MESLKWKIWYKSLHCDKGSVQKYIIKKACVYVCESLSYNLCAARGNWGRKTKETNNIYIFFFYSEIFFQNIHTFFYISLTQKQKQQIWIVIVKAITTRNGSYSSLVITKLRPKSMPLFSCLFRKGCVLLTYTLKIISCLCNYFTTLFVLFILISWTAHNRSFKKTNI